MSFSKDIKKWTDKAERAAVYVFRGTALDIFSKVILRTPVDTGRARGNWQCSINNLASGETTGTGRSALGRAKNATGKAKITDKIYLINNLPYIKKLEYGSSQQAPRGMVRVTLSEYDRIVQARAYQARLKK